MLKRLLIGLVLCVLLGVTIEYNRGTPPRTGEPVHVEDAAGRRLMLLIIDSLSIPNFKKMPALKALAEEGLYAEVEPCLERITYVCVKESLTGRTAFTLFGLFQNFGVGATDPGQNLLREARASGRRVAMVSAGDLKPFHGDVDKNKVFKKGPSDREEQQVIARMQDSDVLLYHYIWHDTQAHHHRVGTKKYKKSVRKTDQMVARMVEALPPDMDLIVAGDHGHAKDGRHVQGLDIPTVVVAKSPNIAPVHETERIPISALRFLSGAVTGMLSDRIDWAPEWTRWLGPEISEETRALVASGSAPTSATYPVGATIICILSIILGAGVGRRWWAPGLGLVAVGMGVGFEAWMGWIHFPKGLPRIHTVLYWAPAAGALLGFIATRKVRGLWLGATATATAIALILFPVVHHYGVLKNIGNLVAPLLACTAVAAAWRSSWRNRVLVLAGAGLAGWAVYQIGDFRIFNLEIKTYRGAQWMEKSPPLGQAVIAALALSLHVALDRGKHPVRWCLGAVAAIGAIGLIELPAYAYIVPVLGAFVGIFSKSQHSGRILSLSTAWAVPFIFPDRHLFGVYATIGIVGIGLWLVRQAEGTAAPGRLARWSAATLTMLGAYLGLAWTFGLTVTGIDFTFAIQWLPGRLHEQYWWVIAILTTWKCLIHLTLIVALIQRIYGDHARSIADTAAGFGLLRYAVVACFATAWLVAAGEQAGGLRLAAMLQDGFYWLVLGLLMAALVRRGSPPAALESRS